MKKNKIKEIVLNLDDFQCDINMDELFMIKEHYSDFKVTMFTSPFHQKLLVGEVTEDKLIEWSDIINRYDWIEVCPHGFGHIPNEMNVDREGAEKVINGTEKMFDRIGLDYKKIWKSPYWQTSNEAYRVLTEQGYIVATNSDTERPIIPDMKQYRFNWSIDRPIINKKILKGHGHTVSMGNALNKCMDNVMEIPAGVKWLTISEYIKKYGSD